MPITRRRRATSQPEENTTQATEAAILAGEQTASTAQEPSLSSTNGTSAEQSVIPNTPPVAESAPPPTERKRRMRSSETPHIAATPATQEPQAPQQPEQVEPPTYNAPLSTEQMPSAPVTQLPTIGGNGGANGNNGSGVSSANGDRTERSERSDYNAIEPGRRTARGELFRRPPQIPPQHVQHTPQNHQPSQAAMPQQPPAQRVPQTPTHEINLPLGNLLHLAYNPGYTGAEEARSALLQKLVNESKAGGRARCWNCGSLAVAYDRWSIRSKTFGEVGVAMCEICGVWSVM